MIMYICLVVAITPNYIRTPGMPAYQEGKGATCHLGACITAPGSREIRVMLRCELLPFTTAKYNAIGCFPVFNEVVAKGLTGSINSSPGLINGLKFKAK